MAEHCEHCGEALKKIGIQDVGGTEYDLLECKKCNVKECEFYNTENNEIN